MDDTSSDVGKTFVVMIDFWVTAYPWVHSSHDVNLDAGTIFTVIERRIEGKNSDVLTCIHAGGINTFMSRRGETTAEFWSTWIKELE